MARAPLGCAVLNRSMTKKTEKMETVEVTPEATKTHYTAKEAAKKMAIHETTLAALVKRGTLPEPTEEGFAVADIDKLA